MIGKDKLVVLSIFLVALGLWAAAFRLLRANGASGAKPPSDPPLKPSTVGEFRGFTLQLHNGTDGHPYQEYIDQISLTGANTVSIIIACYQENCSSTSIFVDLRKTPGDSRLESLIDHAHKKGLRVTLMPIVLLENAREDEWRGKIEPTSWDAWWEDYGSIVLRYAKIAERKKVEVYIIGSELLSTESDSKRWRELIGNVRRTYAGRLCYSANWDHYRAIEWWEDLDIIGMTTYYELTAGEEPTLERLVEKWKQIKEDILTWQAKINRPLLFTEVGWPNQKTCARYPWNYYSSPDSPDPQGQANCFEAFFRTWITEKAVAGILVWEWQNRPDQTIGPDDTSYVPMGKPAMKIIQNYFQMPSPWQQPASSTSTSPSTQAATTRSAP